MDIQNNFPDYLEKMKQIQRKFIEYLESTEKLVDNCTRFMLTLTENKIQAERVELKSFLHLLVNISNNRHRTIDFFQKIELIIENLRKEITQFYSNDEIFNIFKYNKRILLYLFNTKILIPNNYIASIITLPEYQKKSYPEYFFPEFKNFFNEKLIQKVESEIFELLQNTESFDEKRLVGENESFICRLIRNDSLQDFIFQINKSNISLSSEIKPSIFETNQFLIGKMPTILEYSAFYGSVNIFKYLYLNKIKLNSSILKFSIHSQNADLIHLLEELQIQTSIKFYDECFYESIKCHHNEIANYIQQNFLNDFNEFDLQSIIESFNYEFFPNELNNDFDMIFCLCKNDYTSIVQFLLEKINFDLNERRIFLQFVHVVLI